MAGRAEQTAAFVGPVAVEVLFVLGPRVGGGIGLRRLILDMAVEAVGLIDPWFARSYFFNVGS